MRFTQNIRISHKISALMVGLIIGFIVIGVTYYVQIKIESDARVESLNSLTFRTQLSDLNAKLTKLLNDGQQAIRNTDEEAINIQQTNIASTRKLLLVLEGLTNEQQLTAVTSELINQFDLYALLFQRLAEQQQLLGTTQPNRNVANETTLQQKLAEALFNSNQTLLLPYANLFRFDEPVNLRVISRLNNDLETLPNTNEFKQALIQDLSTYSKARQDREELSKAYRELNAELTNAENNLSDFLANTLAAQFNTNFETEQSTAEQRQLIQAVVTAIIFAVAMGTAVGVYFLYKSIVFPMVHMQSVIRKINKGKTSSRVKVLSRDELGDLGTAFNQLLDERIKQLEDRSHENDQLNNSIISLIKAVGMIAQKDLTIKVPVSPDITGTVSDAVNLLTTETAKTLHEVKSISEHVNSISEHLQEQSGLVMQFADGEKRQIIATAKALDILARAMNEVASHAQTADVSAVKAIENTQQARHSVEETVSGIRTIRETISETEKRTKRLGDRSQEISGIVSLINTIAERTHILALNASMHAASAGEAGRGFAVVADEVQRLAESARQSTDEIASMVNNMRVETSDTVAIMNTLISQVADGSRLAEEAGKRMADTEDATQALVEEVKYISKQAVQQAEIANRVRDRSGVIRKFTDKTGKQLEQQKIQTDSLKQYADTLVRQVNVFTLPIMDIKPIELPIVTETPTPVDANESAEDIAIPDAHTLQKPSTNISPLHAAG